MSRPWVLYSDFNCPFCYAMHERLQAQGVLEIIQWRGVQHAPHLPIPMAGWSGRLHEELRQEVAMVKRLAPDLPIAAPMGKPNTKSAIELAARVVARVPEKGRELVARFYGALWCEGRDVSDHNVQTELLAAIGLGTVFQEDLMARSVVERWENEWGQTGHSGVPLLVRADGAILIGLAREADLQSFLDKE